MFSGGGGEHTEYVTCPESHSSPEVDPRVASNESDSRRPSSPLFYSYCKSWRNLEFTLQTEVPLSISTKFYKDVFATRNILAWGDWRQRGQWGGHTTYRQCINRGLAQMHTVWLWTGAIRNTKDLRRPPTKPSSLGKGHSFFFFLYLLHVGQNLRQLQRLHLKSSK